MAPGLTSISGAWPAQHQQHLAVAQHVEQAGLGADQLHRVLVLQQDADLLDTVEQGGVVAQRQLLLSSR